MSWINVACLGLVILAVHLDIAGATEKRTGAHPHAAVVQRKAHATSSVQHASAVKAKHTNTAVKAARKVRPRVGLPTRTTTTTAAPTTLKVVTLAPRPTTIQQTVPTDTPVCNECTDAACADCFACETLGGGTYAFPDRSAC